MKKSAFCSTIPSQIPSQKYSLQYRKRLPTDTTAITPSATGTAIHTPVIPKNRGSTRMLPATSPNVRKKDSMAETLPLDNAVNMADVKIFNPQNKKTQEKMENPPAASSKTFASPAAKSPTIQKPPKKAAANTAREEHRRKPIQIPNTFLSCVRFRLP